MRRVSDWQHFGDVSDNFTIKEFFRRLVLIFACEIRQIYGLIMITFLFGSYYGSGITPKATIVKNRLSGFKTVHLKR